MAHIVLSDRLPPKHGMKRLQWLWSNAEQRTTSEQTAFLQHIAAIDAGFPVLAKALDQSLVVFPALSTIPQLSPSESATSVCPICRTNTNDQIQLVKCRHVFCYTCLCAWSEFSGARLTCPLCRSEIALRVPSFLRLASPPQVPATATEKAMPLLTDVIYDPVRDRLVSRQLEICLGKTLVISEWNHTQQRFSHAGSAVVFATLAAALQLHEADTTFHQLIVLDSKDAMQTVTAFVTRFPYILQRWYFATRLSVDHYVLTSWNGDKAQQVSLDEYADFLASELVQK